MEQLRLSRFPLSPMKNGKIAFIGKELGDESDRVVEENDNICAIYHDSAEIEGEVTYDE